MLKRTVRVSLDSCERTRSVTRMSKTQTDKGDEVGVESTPSLFHPPDEFHLLSWSRRPEYEIENSRRSFVGVSVSSPFQETPGVPSAGDVHPPRMQDGALIGVTNLYFCYKIVISDNTQSNTGGFYIQR